MKYQEALDKKQELQYLIGTKDEKGFTVGEILVLPSDSSRRNRYLRQFIMNTTLPNYIGSNDEDCVLWAIDTDYLKKANILFYKDISDSVVR